MKIQYNMDAFLLYWLNCSWVLAEWILIIKQDNNNITYSNNNNSWHFLSFYCVSDIVQSS